MCGIVAYVGKQKAKPFLLEGLRRLEYRGYDSAGCSFYTDKDDFLTQRSVGQVQALVDLCGSIADHETQGIAHTRWATHGVPSEANAHPHRAGPIILVHNGIIENHADLKRDLIELGVSFSSQTDTEVFAKLLESNCQKLAEAAFSELPVGKKEEIIMAALKQTIDAVEGHFAVIFMVQGLKGRIFGVQAGAPLVVGTKDHGTIVGSDLQALLQLTSDLRFIPVGTILVARENGTEFFSSENLKRFEVPTEKIEWSSEKIAKDGYEHFMLKEIHQQPIVIADTLSGRLPLTDLEKFTWDNPTAHEALWKNVKKLHLIACGSAYHSAMVAKYFFEKWARLPVEVDIASEFRYRDPVLELGTLVGVISQSGETADTLAALRLANTRGLTTFSVCNVPSSTIMRESHFQYSTKAGPEIGVASTKAFTAQLTVLCALAHDVARLRGLSAALKDYGSVQDLARLPQDIEKVLARAEEFEAIGASLEKMKTILFVGRGTMYPLALEGALKLKEITYFHAEGYAAGELKHGPIALVDKQMTAIVLSPRDDLHAKTLSNLEEIRSRGGKIIGIGESGDRDFEALCDNYIGLAKSSWAAAPILYVIPLQLISYGLARKLEREIDKPRNLAKSVTVE